MKVAFLDRDGTIVKEYEEEGWRGRVKHEMLTNSIPALQKLRSMGYEIIIITNQGLIQQGIISLEEYELFNKSMIQELEKNDISVLDIFYCSHMEKENCNCRKPRPGMIEEALEKYEIEIQDSFVAGDSDCDEGIAKYFDLLFFSINRKTKYKNGVEIKDLMGIVEYLDKEERIKS